MDLFDYTNAPERHLNSNPPVITEAKPLPTKVLAVISRDTNTMPTLLTYAH